MYFRSTGPWSGFASSRWWQDGFGGQRFGEMMEVWEALEAYGAAYAAGDAHRQESDDVVSRTKCTRALSRVSTHPSESGMPGRSTCWSRKFVHSVLISRWNGLVCQGKPDCGTVGLHH
jgi:DNA-directed RNA polymerase beta subunit